MTAVLVMHVLMSLSVSAWSVGGKEVQRWSKGGMIDGGNHFKSRSIK
jgi:hypothetical protein